MPQTDVFGGHQAAGRAFGVVQQLVQALTGLAGRLFQHPLDHACGHIFQQVGGVVKAHILDGAHQLDVGESIHEVVAGLIGHIGECFRCNVLFQQTEHHEAVVLIHDEDSALDGTVLGHGVFGAISDVGVDVFAAFGQRREEFRGDFRRFRLRLFA